MTLLELQKQCCVRLQSAGIEDASFEAVCLLESVTGYSRSQCLCKMGEEIPPDVQRLLSSQTERRIAGEPLQYILGKWSFYGREFFVGEGVLIPRPETEELVETALSVVKANPQSIVFDLCAGSGCIGLTVAKEVPECTVYLFEKYDAAFAYLRKNAENLQAPNAHIVQADIFKDVPPGGVCADLLLSNPPYIPNEQLADLQKEVQREPHTALDGGADGLDFYRAIQKKWMPFVKCGGTVLFECGDGQGQQIADLFRTAAQTNILFDFQNIDRFVQIIV